MAHASSLLLVVPLLAAAWAALVWFDEPLRARLTRRWLPRADSARLPGRTQGASVRRLQAELVRN